MSGILTGERAHDPEEHQGGKDAASPRYIFTRMSNVTRLIFHEADDAQLEQQVEDGLSIEPEYYVPIIPMVLVNGADGIGTGWSSKVPMYDPIDVIANVQRCIDEEEVRAAAPCVGDLSGDERHLPHVSPPVLCRWSR